MLAKSTTTSLNVLNKHMLKKPNLNTFMWIVPGTTFMWMAPGTLIYIIITGLGNTPSSLSYDVENTYFHPLLLLFIVIATLFAYGLHKRGAF